MVIEYFNGILFKLLFGKRIKKQADIVLKDYQNEQFAYRFLEESDMKILADWFAQQDQEQLEFFKPHAFDLKTLQRLYKNPSFHMFGVFDGNILAGYFFLRCFANKKSFTGRIVSSNYQRLGISRKMGKILHHIAWNSKFRVFGTASRDNFKSIDSYKSINNFKIIKELENNYIYFEYLQSEEKPI